jgi:hypothetical protein
MGERLFTFVQMEFPWELGPADGRYLLRKAGGVEGSEPEHVVVLGTVGAARRGGLRRRAHTRPTGSQPAPVPVTRATVVDPVPLSTETQGRAWLGDLDPEREAARAAGALNRMLFGHRIATATAHVHEVFPSQAVVVRVGYGEGEQVADGLWMEARELVLSRTRSRRRASVLRPQERLAVLLSGRGEALVCEELALRARLDLDGGRLALAAIELERAYAAALAELPADKRADLRDRLEELEALREGVERNARLALPMKPRTGEAVGAESKSGTTTGRQALTDEGGDPDMQTTRHALERLEAVLRARTASGFTQPR